MHAINLFAFCLPFLMLTYWFALGLPLITWLTPEFNATPRGWLLAAPVGMALQLLLVFVFNYFFNFPIQSFAVPLTITLLIMALALSYWQRSEIAWKNFSQFWPFILIIVLALCLTGWPLLRYGFNWVSYGNDDWMNYNLAAIRFLHHGFRALPDLNSMLKNQNYSLYYLAFSVFLYCCLNLEYF